MLLFLRLAGKKADAGEGMIRCGKGERRPRSAKQHHTQDASAKAKYWPERRHGKHSRQIVTHLERAFALAFGQLTFHFISKEKEQLSQTDPAPSPVQARNSRF